MGKRRRGFLSIMLLAVKSKGVGDSGHFNEPLGSQFSPLLKGGPHFCSCHLGRGLGRVEVGAKLFSKKPVLLSKQWGQA